MARVIMEMAVEKRLGFLMRAWNTTARRSVHRASTRVAFENEITLGTSRRVSTSDNIGIEIVIRHIAARFGRTDGNTIDMLRIQKVGTARYVIAAPAIVLC